MKLLARFPWLLPVVGSIAALTIAIATVFIGVHFASTEILATKAGTATAHVVQPVAVGADAIAALNGSDAKAPTSPYTGSAQIVLPGTSTAIDPTLAHAIDTAAHSSTPAIDLASEHPATAITGDPCALRPPPSGCPPGLLGSVAHILHTPPDFAFWGMPFPVGVAGQSPGPRTVLRNLCVAASAGVVPIGVLSITPANFQISVWPADDPRTITVFPLSRFGATEPADYQTMLNVADESHLPDFSERCIQLAGLRLNTAYGGSITGTDYIGRTGTPFPLHFNTSGAPTHPGAQISTIGQNIVVVQGLHMSSERVEIRATTLHEDTTQQPTCNNAGRAGDDLTTFTHTETTATADQITQLNAPPNYTQRTTDTFDVPEGSTTLICVRWYPAGSAASWELDIPNYESRALVGAPDRILPRVTFEQAVSHTINAASFSVSTLEGITCGHVGWYSDHGSQGPAPICDNYWLARGGATASSTRVWDRGFSGNLVVTTTTVVGEDRHTEGFLMPLAADECYGACALPPSVEYFLPLTAQASDGYGVFRVDWVNGYSNGRTGWSVSPTEDRPLHSTTTTNYPQLDTNPSWTVNVPRTDQDWANASWSLTVDRAAHFDLKLTLASGVAAPSCKPGGAPLELTGETTLGVSQGISFDGLCLGTSYNAEVTLDDHAGHIVTFSDANVGTWWPRETSRVRVPGIHARLQYTVDAQGSRQSQLEQLTMTVGSTALPNGVPAEQLCSETGHFHGEAQQDVVLSSHTPLHLVMRISIAGRFSVVTNPDGTPAAPPLCENLAQGRLIDIPLTIDLHSVLYSSGDDAPCVGEDLTASTPYPLRVHVCALYAGLGP